VILVSPHDPQKVLETIQRESDRFPLLWRALLTLNVHYFSGNAPVCGIVRADGFELRNRRGPAFSLRATGKVRKIEGGTEIEITFSKPLVPDLLGLLFRRYRTDREVILRFLRERLHAQERV
jgi:hypothetical protein